MGMKETNSLTRVKLQEALYVFKGVPESAPTVMCEEKQTVTRQYQDTQY